MFEGQEYISCFLLSNIYNLRHFPRKIPSTILINITFFNTYDTFPSGYIVSRRNKKSSPPWQSVSKILMWITMNLLLCFFSCKRSILTIFISLLVFTISIGFLGSVVWSKICFGLLWCWIINIMFTENLVHYNISFYWFDSWKLRYYTQLGCLCWS